MLLRFAYKALFIFFRRSGIVIRSVAIPQVGDTSTSSVVDDRRSKQSSGTAERASEHQVPAAAAAALA